MIDFTPLFCPGSVAVIGASPNIVRDRAGFIHSLSACFQGRLYPINPRHTEIEGRPCYARITEVPEAVDYALIMLPREKVAAALRDCVQAKVRFVLVFTSGFSEVGETGLEAELLSILKGSDTRMIGPNCVGAHCPERGLVYYPQMMRDTPGHVGFFSQSGGHALNFLIRGLSMGIGFDKVISVGNQADLKIVDFIEYFAEDPRIDIICGYIEDIKDPERFHRAVRETVLNTRKPIVLWKGGRSADGARATQSHTGALAAPVKVWDGVMAQMGVINAETQNEMSDVLLALKFGFNPRGLRACIAVAGGGSSVELTDAFNANGVSVPELSPEVQALVGTDLSRVNTSTRNPLDLGMFGFAPNVLGEAAERAARDPNIDFIAICLYPELIQIMVRELWDGFVEKMLEIFPRISKPLVVLIPQLLFRRPEVEAVRTAFVEKLDRAGILSFPDAGRAARMAVKIHRYRRFMEAHPGDDR
ncbi:MAG: CoA-binding protein [Syntrophales bacterium]|nr:CoA-binding protein [Syntrophales bacterium]MDD4338821.1 CoA-binding protein [Syntrophales bacterium]HOG06692.1 CoA-binding protein [Syntrophales bacterium]HOS77659.1 CoA-binding protein [Syntrophales bacterium]HPB71300.1 CoA-binding protein [Syntrophales bacterium]